jgi:hypothetical protein
VVGETKSASEEGKPLQCQAKSIAESLDGCFGLVLIMELDNRSTERWQSMKSVYSLERRIMSECRHEQRSGLKMIDEKSFARWVAGFPT